MENTGDLRTFLTEQMEGAANGEDFDASRAKAVCNLAQQIYNTLNIEVRTAVATEKIGEGKIGVVKF